MTFCLSLSWFETGSYYVAQAGLELNRNQASLELMGIFLPLSPGLKIGIIMLGPRGDKLYFLKCFMCFLYKPMILKSP